MYEYTGSCHCGKVVFQLNTDLTYSVICDCSICRRRGATMLRCGENDLKIIKGKENLSLYQFDTKLAEHYFCKTCGIYTFHRLAKLPDTFGVNSGCLEGIDSLALNPVLTKGSKR